MATAYSIQCPACGAPFLAAQTRPTSITTCPHCAYNAPLQDFQAAGMTSLGSATVLPLRRRDPRTLHAPSPAQASASAPAPTPVSAPTSVAVAAAVPTPLAVVDPNPPAFAAPILPEIPYPTAAPALSPAPPMALVPTAPPSPLPPLTPARPLPPPPESFVPQMEFAALAQSAQKHSSLPFWLTSLGVLAFLAVVTSAAWLMWQSRSIEAETEAEAEASAPLAEEVRAAETFFTPNLSPAVTASSSSSSSTPNSDSPPAAIPTPPPSPTLPSLSLPEQHALAERILQEGTELFRQILAQPETRLDHIDQSEKVRSQVTAFFAHHQNLTAEAFQKLPVAPLDLQTGMPVYMIQVTTSASPDQPALLRFHIDSQNRLLLDWPLFEETHEKVLAAFIESPASPVSRWFSVGLRRNHGLEFDASVRDLHHVFDLQASAKSLLAAPGLVVRDLPVGRFLDLKTEWRTIHMARLLLRTRTLDSGQKCVEIVDCEGLGLSQNRAAPPVTESPPSGSTVPE